MRVVPVLGFVLLCACGDEPHGILSTSVVDVEYSVPTLADVDAAFDSVESVFAIRPIEDIELITDDDRVSGERTFGLVSIQDGNAFTSEVRKKIEPDEVIAEMAKLDCRPATFVEMFAFVVAFPDLDAADGIVTLGSFVRDDQGARISPSVQGDASFLTLARRSPDTTLFRDWIFLGICPDAG